MGSNRLMVVVLAVACVAAAGAGGYFAVRQNTVPTPTAAMAPASPASLASRTATGPDRPGAETEAVVRDAASKVPPTAPEHLATETRATSPAGTAKRADPARKAATLVGKSASAKAGQAPPPLDRTWPTSAPSPTPDSRGPASPAQAPAPAPVPAENGTAARTADERAAQEPPRAPEPPLKTFEELVVSANSVIGLQTESRISSETARVEDRVEAKVTRDVKVGGKIAIPAGARAIGSVIQVERGGKFKERARLGIRFTTLVLADGTRIPMSTETIYREGEAPGNSAAAKVGGGAIGGAILGAILGGSKGAAIGATAGAAGGAGVVEAGDRDAVTLPAGSPMTVRLLTPVAVTIEQK